MNYLLIFKLPIIYRKKKHKSIEKKNIRMEKEEKYEINKKSFSLFVFIFVYPDFDQQEHIFHFLYLFFEFS